LRLRGRRRERNAKTDGAEQSARAKQHDILPDGRGSTPRFLQG
jgi:hypothetical protein